MKQATDGAGMGAPPVAGRRSEPPVTVIIPMLNERDFIGPCVEGFLAQSYAGPLEILVIDGGSSDGSRDVVSGLAAAHAAVRLVDNPRRVAAAAANIGIEEAAGEILCFLSAHGVPNRDYVATSVRRLDDLGATGVGGRYLHVGTDPRSIAIGLAMASPFGMASPHRFSKAQAEVDTISHPTFRRDALVRVGGYDETLLRNEDYELNHRLRRAGGRLVFCPEITSVYRPRGSLLAVHRQFYDYGRWKATVMRRHPRSIRLRHLVPPVAVAAVAVTPLLARTLNGRRLVALGVAAYGGLVVAAVARARPRREGASLATCAAAFPVMHISWGTGVIVGATADARSSAARLARVRPAT